MTDGLLRRQEEAWLNPPDDECMHEYDRREKCIYCGKGIEYEPDPTDLPGYDDEED